MSFWRLWQFHVPDLYFSDFVNILTSHNFISWRLRMFLYHLPSFLDGFEHFTLKLFISWWLWTFHVIYFYSLTVTGVSRWNPFFLDDYKCFPSKSLLSWRFKKFLQKQPPPPPWFNKRSFFAKSYFSSSLSFFTINIKHDC